ncbi:MULTISPECIES: glycosyltransferase [unclassified Moorena]|uniref:glycosyltransferase family 2 protein n=1 Tax=unclassified Moorena TaxID=2683338 RepID=UPI0013FF4BB3|nr:MULTISPECIES: glycosyltransferase [unclassified Moorena]NEO16241.1 glycosyltransferase [Moorena sp. SIO3E8]NEQ02103.1 glycosyltransferase [Moorena sp. SIO3F7]
MKLSVVVGTYNRLSLLKQCITSILEETSTPTKIYVTDAGSDDGTIEYLNAIASSNPQVIPILVGEKLGQAKAYNDVFRLIDTPYVCWVSDDNVIVNHGLDTAVKILEEKRKIGMVALKVRDKQGPFVSAPYIGGVSVIGVLNVNQGVLRTSVLKQVGGFCEVFRDYGIDPDLTTKVLFSGHDIVYTKEIAIHHYRNWSSDPNTPEYAQMMERQKQYKALYAERYSKYAKAGWLWQLKKYLWALFRKGIGFDQHYNSDQPIFWNLIPRDWHNIMTSRYISITDPMTTQGKSYHLIQHCPGYLRPRSFQVEPLS